MNLFKNKLTIAAIASTMMLAACGDDSSSSASGDEPSNETGDLYLLSFMMETSQFVGLGSLSDNQSKLVQDFIEAPNTGAVAYFDGSVYTLVSDGGNSTLSRYEVKNGHMADKAAAKAKFKGTNAIMMKFVDENKMYVEQALGDAITALDPKTLKTTATIDLSSYIDEESGALTSAKFCPTSRLSRESRRKNFIG